MTSSQPTTSNETWTIRRLLGWAAEDFRQRGLESPRLEAELLLGHALGMTRIDLIVKSDLVPNVAELNRFRDLVRRRRAAEPTAYLLGQREFYGIPMRVDRRVLIPRPDTETLVQVALERSRRRSAHGHALDLCTGSGCVAIAFARQRPGWSVTGVDISNETLQVAQDNALRVGNILGLAWQQGDLFDALAKRRFDLITANPPYIPSSVYGTLDPTVRDFEPKLALDGGEDGLDVTRRIVKDAPDWLEPDGILAVEIGYDQGAAVADLFAARGFADVACNRDYGGRDRVVSGRWVPSECL
jgi:release factor glutamine methyltransferase